jgi:methylenetetrahydrofolate--tRNA-(uracil-5-)-methyltransferase
MRRLDSLLMRVAGETEVPAGKALAVDRERFARQVTEIIEQHPLIEIHRQEIKDLPPPGQGPLILATGPLTSPDLSDSLALDGEWLPLRCHLSSSSSVADRTLSPNRATTMAPETTSIARWTRRPISVSSMNGKAEYVPGGCLRSEYFEGCLPIGALREAEPYVSDR